MNRRRRQDPCEKGCLRPQFVCKRPRWLALATLQVAGGVIPAQDYAMLHESGVAAIFGPGTRIPAAARAIINDLDARLPQPE